MTSFLRSPLTPARRRGAAAAGRALFVPAILTLTVATLTASSSGPAHTPDQPSKPIARPIPRPIVGRTGQSLRATQATVASATPASSAGVRAARARIEQRIRGFEGVLGIAARNLDTGEEIAINADTRFPTASLIKTAVMVEAYHQIADGKFRRDTIVTLTDADKVGDEPVVLNQMHAGLPLSVSDLLALMIAFSDNTATNMLVHLVGTANVDRRMASYELPNTKLFRPTFRDGQADVFPEEEKEFGLGMTTPREMARLFALIAEGKIVSRAVSDEMIGLMDQQQDKAMIPRSLPYERDTIKVASKSGFDEEKHAGPSGVKGHVRTDAAYVRGPKARFVIAICTRQVKDRQWGVDNAALKTGAAIAREVYGAFSASTPGAGR